MSISPAQTTSAKRPLEDASSPSRHSDQPDAKRPALESAIKTNNAEEVKSLLPPLNGEPPSAAISGNESLNSPAVKANGTAADRDKVVVSEAPAPVAPTSKPPLSTPAAAPDSAGDESTWIHIRAAISSTEAATVIGKGGENVSNIRKMANARCTVSDYQKGAVERILTVSGGVDAVAKAFGLIIRTLNNEALAEPSNHTSKTYALRLLVPHVLIGSIIGKGGSRIREIQEASGARLNASDACLPSSTERALVITGVADAIHIATYYVGSTLLEQLTDRFGGPAASAYATRAGTAVGVVPGGLQVVPYLPQPAQGHYGNREHYSSRRQEPRPHMASGGYGGPGYGQTHAGQGHPNMPMHFQPQIGYGPASAPHMQPPHQAPHPVGGHAGPHGAAHPMPGPSGIAQPVTQQIYIPNDMVGAIIGKGGQKINEIRQMSGSIIKINEPVDNSNERLVTISGTEECNRVALYMLYARLGQLAQLPEHRHHQSMYPVLPPQGASSQWSA